MFSPQRKTFETEILIFILLKNWSILLNQNSINLYKNVINTNILK
jgi:hypothetical protein